MTRVRKITASITFGEGWVGDLPDEEEAIQSLAESVSDDSADITFEYEES